MLAVFTLMLSLKESEEYTPCQNNIPLINPMRASYWLVIVLINQRRCKKNKYHIQVCSATFSSLIIIGLRYKHFMIWTNQNSVWMPITQRLISEANEHELQIGIFFNDNAQSIGHESQNRLQHQAASCNLSPRLTLVIVLFSCT